MTEQDIDVLLYAGERATIDFKAEQYRISKNKKIVASDDGSTKEFKRKKSELLKDVLAMANAWRNEDSYILIGFKEKPPGLPELIGLQEEDFYDDSVYQQFVTENLSKHLEFNYSVTQYKGKSVGVIRIPLKQPERRPYFCKETYGIVEEEVVYVRRGSSTHCAGPEEIARMGAEDAAHPNRIMAMNVRFTDEEGHSIDVLDYKCVVPVCTDMKRLPDFTDPSHKGLKKIFRRPPNPNYWRQLMRWHKFSRLRQRIKIEVLNASRVPVTNCKMDIWASDENGKPRKLDVYWLSRPEKYRPVRFDEWSLYGREVNAPYAGTLVESVEIKNLRPGEMHPLNNRELRMYLGDCKRVVIHYRIIAQELPEPIEGEAVINMSVTEEQWTFEMLQSDDRAAKLDNLDEFD